MDQRGGASPTTFVTPRRWSLNAGDWMFSSWALHPLWGSYTACGSGMTILVPALLGKYTNRAGVLLLCSILGKHLHGITINSYNVLDQIVTNNCLILIYFSFFKKIFYWLHHAACGILVPRSGIKPMPFAWDMLCLNHWTTREFPVRFPFQSCLQKKKTWKEILKIKIFYER